MPKAITDREFGDIKICPVCGKRFNVFCYEDWVYRKDMSEKTGKDARSKRLLFCSWGCLRKWEKQREEEMKARRRKRYLGRE